MESSGILMSQTQTEPVATADGTKVITSQETDDNYYQVPQGEKAAHEMVLMCPSFEDQCLPVMSQEAAMSWLDQYLQADELGLWGGLWNWNLQQDDPHCNKIAMQTQPKAAYSFGGDANNNNNLYNGGYIF
ncbi:putative r2r3-myb transcription factor [Corchorus capsularis]|uniref:Putative r2r3-myb transcription factor n=1 Tax=Corchorus capsularis TaxID=210143 RepID=A0A1R3JY99_COCAP|nr:putative r2r3-myb transcription factor [Corchorus capsularis]